MAIHSPSDRIWWNKPIEKMELIWIGIAFLWGLFMFCTMIWWHVYGDQNLSNETYKISAELYEERTEAMVDAYTVREEGDTGIPVVHPPAGADVYLLARKWEFYPILELEKGQSYRVHMSSTDWQHGFSLQPININLQIQPGYEMVLTITPDSTGEFTIVCNEYCGIGHHQMLGRIHVVE